MHEEMQELALNVLHELLKKMARNHTHKPQKKEKKEKKNKVLDCMKFEYYKKSTRF